MARDTPRHPPVSDVFAQPVAAGSGRRRWGPLAAWTMLLVIATSWPSPHVPHVPNGDTVVHALLYGILAYTAWRAWFWPGERTVTATHAALLVAAVIAFGWADEWHQQFIPGRSRSSADWHVDSIGALAGAAAAAFVRRGLAAA